MLDLARQTLSPFVTSGSSQTPLWTRDGTRIIYRGTRQGFRNLYSKAADGTGVEERLIDKADAIQTPTSPSPDGEWLIFTENSGDGTSVWKVPLNPRSRDKNPQVILAAGNQSLNGVVSPDGQWLAFQSTLSGRLEVWVQPFPGPGPQTPVSTGGGAWPRWSKVGRELYFDSLDDKVMAAEYSTAGGFSTKLPRVLFPGRFKTSANSNTAYDLSLDNRRFLRVQQGTPEAGLTEIHVVLNWASQLGRR